MTLRGIVLGLFLIPLVMLVGGRIADHNYDQDLCTWHCHNAGCTHSETIGSNFLPRSWDLSVLAPNVDLNAWRSSAPWSWRELNWIVYAVFFPLIALAVSLWWWSWRVVLLGALGALGFSLFPMNEWYDICTEFCIHLGNWTGLHYAGVCFWLFLVTIPLFILIDLACSLRFAWRKWRR